MLPEAERAGWQAFWDRFAAVRKGLGTALLSATAMASRASCRPPGLTPARPPDADPNGPGANTSRWGRPNSRVINRHLEANCLNSGEFDGSPGMSHS